MTEKKATPLGVYWMRANRDKQHAVQQRLGKRAANVRQVAYGHREASAAMAGAIVDAVNGVEGQQVITRGDVCNACAACPHYLAACAGTRSSSAPAGAHATPEV